MRAQLEALGGAVTINPRDATTVVVMDKDLFVAASANPALLPRGSEGLPLVTDAWVRACCTHYDLLPVAPPGRASPSTFSPVLGL
jgi:hypothetical protein